MASDKVANVKNLQYMIVWDESWKVVHIRYIFFSQHKLQVSKCGK